MNTYRLKVKPNIRYAVDGVPQLTDEILMQSLKGVVVRELRETPFGEHIVDVHVQRPTEREALEELTGVLLQLGFSVVEAGFSRWVNQAVAKALGYAFGVLIVGTGISKKPVLGLASSALTFLIVSAIETEAYKLVAEYEARRDHAGNWTFRQISPSPDLGFSPA